MDSGRPDKGKEKPSNVRIQWARSLTNHDIGTILQTKLLESRTLHKTRVGILNELAHEIKYRLTKHADS